jgi:hypothetical protein
LIASMRAVASGFKSSENHASATASTLVRASTGTSRRPGPTPHADIAAVSQSRFSRASASMTPRNSAIGVNCVT